MPPRHKPEPLGNLFIAEQTHTPIGSAFTPTRSTATPPRVWEFSRVGLAALRPLLEEHGWPVKQRDAGRALLAAQRAGQVDISPLIRRYGEASLLSTPFIVLPQLDRPEYHRPANTFAVERFGDVLVLQPPGQREEPTGASALLLPMLYFPFAGPQEDFHAACEFEVLFGGSKGGTKTESFVADAARYCDEPLYKAYIFRKTVDGFTEILRRAKLRYGTTGDALGATYYEASKEFRFPGGPTIILRHLDRESAADIVQGQEPTRCYVDESAQIGDRKVIEDRIRSEIRSPNKTLAWGLRESANPIGPGVPRLKRRYIDPCGATGERVHQEHVDVPGVGPYVLDRRVIPSRVKDNPVYRNDARYMAILMTLSPGMRALLLDGDWSKAQGAFYDQLDKVKHFPADLPDEVPAWANLRGGFDWGFAHRHWLVIGYRDDKGRLVIADSVIGRQEEPTEVAERWKAWQEAGPDGKPRRFPRIIHSSPGLFDRRAETKIGSMTRAQEFAREGFPLLEGDEGPNSRRRKAETLRKLISWRGHEGDAQSGLAPKPDGEPMLVFMDTPRNRILYAQLEMIVPDPDHPEEPLKVNYDEDATDWEGPVPVNVSGDDGQDATWFLVDTDRGRAGKPPEEKQAKSKHFDHGFDTTMERLAAANRPGGRGF
jgi:hypothetical protein